MPWSELNWEKGTLLGTYVKTVEQPSVHQNAHAEEIHTTQKRD